MSPGSRTSWTTWLFVALACGVAGVLVTWNTPRPVTVHGVIPGTCTEVITPTVARAVFDQAMAVRVPGMCTLDGVETRAARLEIRWRAGGQPMPPAVVVPRGCAPTGAELRGDYALRVDPVVARSCGPSLEAVRRALGGLAPPPGGDAEGAAVVWLLRLEAALLLGVFVLAASLARDAVQSLRGDRRALTLLGGSFLLALGARLAVKPLPANWYADVLAAGAPLTAGRFGPGGALYQAALRSMLPWGDRTLFGSNAVVGALSVPLFLAVLRVRRVDDMAVAAVGVLVALAPLHVRVSASDSDHVLCSTLQVAQLLAWVHAARTGDRRTGVLALLLIPTAALVRVDAWWQLGAVPCWSLLADPGEDPPALRDRVLRGVLYGCVWGVTGAVLYALVALPSHHPFPEAAGLVLATRQLFSQYVTAAREAPHWVSPVAVVLALPGTVALARRRPALLVGVGASLAAAFIPLGRNLLHDGLVGARYFLVTVPVALTVSGCGLAALVSRVPRGVTDRADKGVVPGVVPGVVLGVLALSVALPALPAYRYRYTFQDEYVFLRAQLARLPDGCAVETLPIRDGVFNRDLDCCLDVPRSSLTLAFPRLQFATLAVDNVTLRPPVGCTVYYQSAACAMHETPEVRTRDARTYAMMQRRCAHVRADGGLLPVARVSVSPAATNGFFESTRPVVGLYRRQPGELPR